MRSYRKKQIAVILILVAVIVSVSIGYAAFSATLNISSSANVKPNSSAFSMVFSSSSFVVNTKDDAGTVVSGVGTGGAQGGMTGLYRTHGSGLTAQFTEPGQTVATTIYIHNVGEYDAYLVGLNIASVDGDSYKKCTAGTGTTNSLVQAACDGMRFYVTIGGHYYEWGSYINGHKVSKGAVEPVIITVSYDSGSARADGPFDVLFGDISFEYSTVDSIKMVSFKINGVAYQAEEGMTFADWIRSSYNTGNYSISAEICNAGSAWYPIDVESTYITENDSYDAAACKAVD